jgi:hypothetical protein
VTAPLAYRLKDAAEALSISTDSFERHVKPHVRCVRLGTVRLYPASALQAFLDENAVSPADELARRRRSSAA